jgi:competence protein ComEA
MDVSGTHFHLLSKGVVVRSDLPAQFILALLLLFAPAPGPPLPALTAGAQAPAEERINLNTASKEELMKLPGVGPVIADRIIEHRRKHGPFKRPQEVIVVRGMSAKRYRLIAHLIRT